MSQTIEQGTSRNAAQFLIQNDESSNIAIEFRVKARDMNTFGEEILTETKDISVFPPQLIVPPGEKRTIRVTYNLKDNISVEKSYRVYAEQLPLKVDQRSKEQAGIKVLMQYVAALYVSPQNSKSDLKLLKLEKDNDFLVFEFENSGNKHQLINNPTVTIKGEKTKEELKTADLKGIAGENVLAGHKRIFKLKSSREVPPNAKFELKIHD